MTLSMSLSVSMSVCYLARRAPIASRSTCPDLNISQEKFDLLVKIPLKKTTP